ncbi:hypothetical protein E4U60_004963 [Claviceps pazoutovae]|uniref:Uncharacterized protein n=1 Tax=Claviceps pazoutovae TaxID=1649127 RepID=A0A9P7SKC7_9HYPO|nr:hypothetical protein E4U60_004963 [Claviceps pazoutovae]
MISLSTGSHVVELACHYQIPLSPPSLMSLPLMSSTVLPPLATTVFDVTGTDVVDGVAATATTVSDVTGTDVLTVLPPLATTVSDVTGTDVLTVLPPLPPPFLMSLALMS